MDGFVGLGWVGEWQMGGWVGTDDIELISERPDWVPASELEYSPGLDKVG